MEVLREIKPGVISIKKTVGDYSQRAVNSGGHLVGKRRGEPGLTPTEALVSLAGIALVVTACIEAARQSRSTTQPPQPQTEPTSAEIAQVIQVETVTDLNLSPQDFAGVDRIHRQYANEPNRAGYYRAVSALPVQEKLAQLGLMALEISPLISQAGADFRLMSLMTDSQDQLMSIIRIGPSAVETWLVDFTPGASHWRENGSDGSALTRDVEFVQLQRSEMIINGEVINNVYPVPLSDPPAWAGTVTDYYGLPLTQAQELTPEEEYLYLEQRTYNFRLDSTQGEAEELKWETDSAGVLAAPVNPQSLAEATLTVMASETPTPEPTPTETLVPPTDTPEPTDIPTAVVIPPTPLPPQPTVLPPQSQGPCWRTLNTLQMWHDGTAFPENGYWTDEWVDRGSYRLCTTKLTRVPEFDAQVNTVYVYLNDGQPYANEKIPLSEFDANLAAGKYNFPFGYTYKEENGRIDLLVFENS